MMSAKYHLKFYADCPSGDRPGDRNKLFCYGVHHGRHASDLLARFVANGYTLRACFLGVPGAKGARVPPIVQKNVGTDVAATFLLAQYPD